MEVIFGCPKLSSYRTKHGSKTHDEQDGDIVRGHGTDDAQFQFFFFHFHFVIVPPVHATAPPLIRG